MKIDSKGAWQLVRQINKWVVGVKMGMCEKCIQSFAFSQHATLRGVYSCQDTSVPQLNPRHLADTDPSLSHTVSLTKSQVNENTNLTLD